MNLKLKVVDGAMKSDIPWSSAKRKTTPDERLLSIQAKDGGQTFPVNFVFTCMLFHG